MQVVQNENVDFFDCDDTLIMHQDPASIPPSEIVQVLDAVTAQYVTLRINRPMVRLLMESKTRGSTVVVWSRGGWQWAQNVVQALKLEGHVHFVMSKPMAYFDDKDIAEWLPYRVYIGPDTIYKRTNT